MDGLLQLIGGCSRDGCFESQGGKDMSLVCHEVRGVELQRGEHLFVSVREASDRREGELLFRLGSPCQLRQVTMASTLLLTVWGSKDPELARARQGEKPRIRSLSNDEALHRRCGELRIPMGRLTLQCQSLLYQTWVTLDSPGDDETFNQIIARGAQQVDRPRVSLSICRTADLSDGKLIFSEADSEDQRALKWVSLLRSQQQHEVICRLQVAQQSPSISNANSGGDDDSCKSVRELVQTQAREIESLKQALVEAERGIPSPSRGGVQVLADDGRPRGPVRTGRLSDVEELQRTRLLEEELARLREDNFAQQQEIDTIQGKIDSLQSEANCKIDAANDRMRSLRHDRDTARDDAKRRQEELMVLDANTSELQAELRFLADRKEHMMQLLEDINKDCEHGTGGMSDQTRRSLTRAMSEIRRPSS